MKILEKSQTKNKLSLVFFGTPDFAVPSLKVLINDRNFKILSVVTQPDKPVGRKQVLTPPPIKIIAQNNNIKVLQPRKIKEVIDEIGKLNPDLIIVAAYGKIFPQELLNIPRYGCVNVHGSLLPRHRGASCIQGALLAGDQESGATIMLMDAGMDTGPILAQSKVTIDSVWTSKDLYEKISYMGAEILASTVLSFVNGNIKPIPQNDFLATYTKILKKEDNKIDWSKSANELERFVRAMDAYAEFYILSPRVDKLALKAIKIHQVRQEALKINQYKPGELFLFEGKLCAQCGKDALVIEKLQVEGKKVMISEEFLRGNKNIQIVNSDFESIIE